MLKYIVINGEDVPCFICEVCGGPVLDLAEAHAVRKLTSTDTEEQRRLRETEGERIVIVHKGDCDQALTGGENRMSYGGWWPLYVPLKQMLDRHLG